MYLATVWLSRAIPDTFRLLPLWVTPVSHNRFCGVRVAISSRMCTVSEAESFSC